MFKRDCKFGRICADSLKNLGKSGPEAVCIRKIGLFEIVHAVQKVTHH
jgi:hypothetical protein